MTVLFGRHLLPGELESIASARGFEGRLGCRSHEGSGGCPTLRNVFVPAKGAMRVPKVLTATFHSL
jgi:hypothetical protein